MILFISHLMTVISSICLTDILLKDPEFIGNENGDKNHAWEKESYIFTFGISGLIEDKIWQTHKLKKKSEKEWQTHNMGVCQPP